MNTSSSIVSTHSPGADLRSNSLTAFALGALLIAMWMVQHVHGGIWHDAQIYTLQALARLKPEALGWDLFLRFGSQDRFTIFSALYGRAIDWWGIVSAPAVMVFIGQCGFCAGLILLARRLLPGPLVWIAVALVMLVPYTYGAHKVFYIVEDFVTPRLWAEALVLAALGVALGRQLVLAVALLVLAALLHPIMAAAGFIVMLFLDEVPKRVRLGLLLLLVAASIGVFVVLANSGNELRFDDAWWGIVHSGLAYLFPLEWSSGDWVRIVLLAGMLCAGLVTLEAARARALCRAALIAGSAGIVVNILGSDLQRLIFVSAVQPWRMLWLTTVIAAMLTPAIAIELWRRGDLARGALLTLLTAQLIADETYALGVAGVAVVLLVLALRPDAPNQFGRLAFFGGCAFTALGVIVNLVSGSIVARPMLTEVVLPEWLDSLRFVFATGLVPVTLFCMVWWVTRVWRRPATDRLFAIVTGIAVLALAPTMLSLWRQSHYTDRTLAAFAPWRAIIPARSEVLWFDEPLSVWFLLERPSFVSNAQTSIAVFSRRAAMTSWHRIQILALYLDTEPVVAWRPPVPKGGRLPITLESVCASGEVSFVVTRMDLAAQATAVLPGNVHPDFRGEKLYACPIGPAAASAGSTS